MDEVPRTQLPLLAFDDQHRFAQDDEEGLLVGLPVIHGHRFAWPEHEGIDAELFCLTLSFEIVERNADGAAAVRVTPDSVAHVDDEPSVARRDEPVLGLLQFRLENHERQIVTGFALTPRIRRYTGGRSTARIVATGRGERFLSIREESPRGFR